MHPRQKELFKHIVEEYIKTALPVGSKLIVEKFNWDISPATIRNDMMELENAELIFQPHTSAGRVPTEFGYKKYVIENVDLAKMISEKDKNDFLRIIENYESGSTEKIKQLAKILAEKSGLSAVVGFQDNDVYYTGLSNLFSQPEFQDLNLVCNLSVVIDHLDEAMQNIYGKIDKEVMIKIGAENPFAHDCAAVLVKIKNILIGIVGPMRMNYQKNAELINFAKNIL